MKKNALLIIVLFSGIAAWQCSKQTVSGPGTTTSLKASLNTGSQKLIQAVSNITQSKGYEILTLNSSLKSAPLQDDAIFKDSITLSGIKGIYEYQPVTYRHWCYGCFTKLFKKTGDTSLLIAKLPSDKIFHPSRFQTVVAADSTLKNNFVISATAYHYYFNMGFLHDYKLTAGVKVSDTAVGNIDIQSVATSLSNYASSTAFSFPSGYTLNSSVKSGDTASLSFSISSPTETLLKETVNLIKTQGSKFHEKQYILDIGNVEIVKSSVTDSFKIYVSGVLQTNAKVEVIDNTSSTEQVSIFRNRDIQITFDDGTKTTISALIGPSFAILENLATSIQDVYFASNIVNYIAWNIYKNRIQ